MSYGVASKKVAVIDDKALRRATFALELEDEDFLPEVLSGHYGTIDNLVEEVYRKECHAAVCDFRLNQNSYVMGTGAQAVASMYRRNLPSILVTNIDDEIIDQIRPYRQFIPVLLDKDKYESEDLRTGLHICELELGGIYQPNRRPWRATVRVDAVNDSGWVTVVVPGWNPDVEIQVPITVFPEKLRPLVIPEQHFFAQVNIGAETQEELYFKDFEDKE